MTLEKRIEQLPENKQIELAIKFLEIGLPIWTEFAKNNGLEYSDTVVGMHHKIDDKIVEKAIELAKRTIDKKNTLLNAFKKHRISILQEEYLEPLTALQDLDWEIPEEPKLIFYSTHNLLEKLAGKEKTVFNELTIYVSINQSIDAIQRKDIISTDEIKKILKNAG